MAAAAAAGGGGFAAAAALSFLGAAFAVGIGFGRHGGVVNVIVGGSVVGFDVFGGIVDVVVVNFLFFIGNFLV